MAVDVYSDNFVDIISPRLSFSNDLKDDETTNNSIDVNLASRLDHSLSDSTFDFAFNVDSIASFQASTADELFSNGKILPIPTPVRCLDPPSPSPTLEEKKKSLKEFLEDSIEEEDEEEEEEERDTIPGSFWKFRRSSSLNCDRNRRKGLIGSWKILSRSGSTGKFLEKIVEEDEIDNNKAARKSFWKFNRNNNSLLCEPGLKGSVLSRIDSISEQNQYFHHNQKSNPFRRSSSLNCEARKGINRGLTESDKYLARSYSSGSAPKKQQEFAPVTSNSGKKGQVNSNCKGYGYGSYNNNLRVNSLLNLPSPYISRVSVDLFGFRMFCNGNSKDRKKRK